MSDHALNKTYDAVIVGAGPAGLAASLALQMAGLEVVCVGPLPASDQPDRRTTALLAGSIVLLRDQLHLWDRIAPKAEPLVRLRLIDRTGRLFRAPDVGFDASETDSPFFGYNVPNTDLVGALVEKLGNALIPTSGVTDLHLKGPDARIELAEGQTLTARLVVGADGRNSFCRQAIGARIREWSYPQTAIVCNFRHSRPHRGACTELHYPNGPFTVVPLPGDRSSLVWVEERATAETLHGLSDEIFAAEIAARLEGLLGRIVEVEPRGAFPLSGLVSRQLTGPRVALIGEAAHVMPPIGAQGLNLGFRDVADLVASITGQPDPGSEAALAEYQRKRRSDVWLRTLAADLLNRTLISDIPLLQIARSAGLSALSMAGPLRRAAMRQGMAAAK